MSLLGRQFATLRHWIVVPDLSSVGTSFLAPTHSCSHADIAAQGRLIDELRNIWGRPPPMYEGSCQGPSPKSLRGARSETSRKHATTKITEGSHSPI
jgi:hypothetical protein